MTHPTKQQQWFCRMCGYGAPGSDGTPTGAPTCPHCRIIMVLTPVAPLTSNERTASYADLLVMVAQRDTEIERLQKSIDRCGTEEGVCYAVEMERKDKEIERLRAALGSAVLMVNKLKVFGADNVQRYDVEPWLKKVRERFPNLPNAWPFTDDGSVVETSPDARDAARYRFLRQPGNAIVYAKDRNAWGQNASGHVRYDTPEQLDAAIDAALGSVVETSIDGCRYPMSGGRRCDSYPNCVCGTEKASGECSCGFDCPHPNAIHLEACPMYKPWMGRQQRRRQIDSLLDAWVAGSELNAEDSQRIESLMAPKPLCNCKGEECHGPEEAEKYGYRCRDSL